MSTSTRPQRLTESSVVKLKGPVSESTKKQIEYTDSDVIGLKIEVGKSQQGSYRFRYTSPRGRKSSIRIGTVGAMSLTEARQKAREYRAMLDRDDDPQDVRQRQREQPSLAEFIADTYLPWASIHKRSYKDDVSRCTHHIIPALGEHRLCDLRFRDIEQFKKQLTDKVLKPGTVNRVLALLSAICRQAILHEIVVVNACANVKLFPEKTGGQRYLNSEEVGRLMAALNQDENTVAANALKLLLLTGCRREEILKLQWRNVDMASQLIRLEQTKNGEIRHVPLSADAMAILQKQRVTSKGPWVFPGRDDNGKCINNVRKTMERAQKAAGIEQHVHIHALRHTAASLAVRNGVPLYTVQHMLGHKTARMTQRYAHLADDNVRSGNEVVAKAIAQAMSGVSQVTI